MDDVSSWAINPTHALAGELGVGHMASVTHFAMHTAVQLSATPRTHHCMQLLQVHEQLAEKLLLLKIGE